WSMLRELRRVAAAERPDVFVAIDFPDFNFRLLPAMKTLGIPIVYYVSPQLWAWRPGRIETIKQYVDKMLVIFPFEEANYAKAHVSVEFVGPPGGRPGRAPTRSDNAPPRSGSRPGQTNDRALAGKPAERADADSADARRGRGDDDARSAGPAVLRGAGAASCRHSVRAVGRAEDSWCCARA